MRYRELLELAGVKRFRDKTASDILAYYRNKLGDGPVKLLGDGAHAAAIMIGQNVYKLWLQDSAYTDFVKYALQNQNNPFLPKFLSRIKQIPAFFRRHADAPDLINYIKMEKLLPVNKHYTFHLNIQGQDANLFNSVTLLNTISALENTFNSIEPSFPAFVERLSEELEYELTEQDITDDLKLLVDTVIAIMNSNPNANHVPDLHLNNFMMRGDQLVILDPIHNWQDTDINDEYFQFDKQWGSESGMGKPAVTSKFIHDKENNVNDEEDYE